MNTPANVTKTVTMKPSSYWGGQHSARELEGVGNVAAEALFTDLTWAEMELLVFVTD
jgi:hypothetical protein